MNIRKRLKRKLKTIPRSIREIQYLEDTPRKNGLYYNSYCCKSCYFDWGRWFEKKHMYKHDSAQSNYDGLLKKYWTSPNDFREEDLEPYDE